MRTARLILLACAALALVVPVVAAAPRAPGALDGVPLRGATGIRLLVSDTPPRILDVDRGRTTRVAGIPKTSLAWVAGLGGRSGVVVADVPGGKLASAELYGVRAGAARATPLGSGWEAAPAANGRSVWVKRFDARSRCSLRQVALDGRVLRGPRAFPCAWVIEAGNALGLVVHTTALWDPVTTRTTLRSPARIVAAVGTRLVLEDGEHRLSLVDTEDGTRRALRWPSVIDPGGQGGLDAPAVDPSGRFVALGFGDPAWHLTGNQVLDIWILDTETGRLTQLPGMPAFVHLKHTSMAWTADGRLVLLVNDDRGYHVAVWRPGQARLALRSVGLAGRSGGSDTFAPLS